MSKHLIIVGGGPRGLGLALYASLYSDLRITLIDPSPLSSWTPPNIIPNIVMRSPASFDLVTGLEGLEDYSLSKFITGSHSNLLSQREIEADTTEVKRDVFLEYLTYVKNKLTNVKFSESSVNLCGDIFVRTENRQINYDYVAFCIGNGGTKKIPAYISNTSLKYKTISLQALVLNPPSNQKLCVIGSGQGASEMVHFLASNNNYVYWVRYPLYKEDQYPVPSYRIWNAKSALGEYYKNITESKLKLKYLEEVKAFGPSITPYIVNKLESVKSRYEVIDPNRKDIATYLSRLELDGISLMTGNKINIDNLLPLFSYSIPLDRYNSNFPLIEKDFRIKHSNIFISGVFATYYDGPRQNSVISVGDTSKRIVEEILSR